MSEKLYLTMTVDENNEVIHKSTQRGLGDTVEKVLKFFGIEKKGNCKCAERQAALNKLIAYKGVKHVS